MPKVLLVEDDKDVARVTQDWLEAEGYSLDIAREGNAGYEYVRQGNYDVIILDWQLPGLSGVEICQRFRAAGGTTPVLMLTGLGSIDNKTQGLDAGADDYLTKPFNMKELSARLRALLRRGQVAMSTNLVVGKVELDPVKHIVTVDGAMVHMQPKEFALLEFLMRHPGEIFSTEALILRVWGMEAETTSNAIRTSIKRLRKLIDEGDNEDESMIENVRAIGYRLKDR